MLDPTREVAVSSGCGARVFADDEAPGVFYALPIRPGVAVEDGHPVLRLLLVRQHRGHDAAPTRATLSLTTQFSLTSSQLDEVASEVTRRLAQGPPRPTPALVIAPVEWVRGEVRVSLLAEAWAQLQGTPSLIGRNECALAMTVGPDEAKTLAGAWHAGLPDARVAYDMVARAATATRGSARAETRGHSPSSRASVDVSIASRQAHDWHVTAEGPLGVPAPLPARALQQIDL